MAGVGVGVVTGVGVGAGAGAGAQFGILGVGGYPDCEQAKAETSQTDPVTSEEDVN